MPKVQANGINLYYETRGGGFPLLMIYGLGGNLLGWREELLSLLADRYRLLLFDNRGVGRSDKPEGPYSMAMMADDAAGLLESLGIERAHVFGISMGGMIAQELALRHPQKVVGLVLGCTTCGVSHGIPTSQEVQALLRPDPSLSPEEEDRRWREVAYPPAFVAANQAWCEAHMRRKLQYPTPLHGYTAQLMAAATFDTCGRLPQIASPTLVITGAEDKVIPPANSDILAERIPGARLLKIPQAGHNFFNEKPEETAVAILSFLDEVMGNQQRATSNQQRKCEWSRL